MVIEIVVILFQVKEEEMTLHELYNADEAFFTGTATEIVPISEVDGRTIGNGKPGPITRDLIRSFRKIRRSGTPINSS